MRLTAVKLSWCLRNTRWSVPTWTSDFIGCIARHWCLNTTMTAATSVIVYSASGKGVRRQRFVEDAQVCIRKSLSSSTRHVKAAAVTAIRVYHMTTKRRVIPHVELGPVCHKLDNILQLVVLDSVRTGSWKRIASSEVHVTAE